MKVKVRKRMLLWAVMLLLSLPAILGQPSFDNVGTPRMVSEAESVGYNILTLTTTPSSGVTISIDASDPNSNLFAISGTNILVTTGALDYEDTKVYRVVLKGVDTANSLSATSTLTVSVTNVNDATPAFSSPGSNTASVPEGSVGHSLTFGYAVSDPDAADASLGEKLTYSLQDTDASNFVIDSNTGAISTAVRLDRETISSYTHLVVKVVDAASHTATLSLTVYVTDINDVTPSCTQSVYFLTVAEETASGTSLLTLTCTDTDTAANANPTASIASPSGSYFTLSGFELRTGATPLDYDAGPTSHTLVIRVTDAGSPPLTGTVSVLVTVTGVNDHTPAWATWTPSSVLTSASLSLPESTAVGSSLFTIAATDADRGSTVTYSIHSLTDSANQPLTGVFLVDSTSGLVSTLAALEREGAAAVAEYRLTVKAVDEGGSDIRIAITVTVTDANDVTPVFSQPSNSVTMAEDQCTAGATLVTLTATDGDVTATTLTYSVATSLTGLPASTFGFSTTNIGRLQLASLVDLDVTGTAAYTVLRVTVTDTVHTATATVTVTITSVNDYTPAFGATTPAGTISLSESSAVGTSVATVTATDQDVGTDGAITYSITGGNTGSVFLIGGTSGVIQTVGALNYETTTSYNLVVTATDGGVGPAAKSATVTVSVTVTDVNDVTPVFSQPSNSVTKAEDQCTAGASLITLTATDGDVTATTLTYSVAASLTGLPASTFQFSATTSGRLELASAVDLDVTGTAAYTVLRVTVTDSVHTATASVTVTITSVNEHTPVFGATSPAGTISLSESAVVGTSVATVTATDQDLGTDGAITYSITGGNTGSVFLIGGTSGVIQTVGALNYEAATGYGLEVTATDGGVSGSGSAKSATVTVSVAVTNVNDNAPTCSSYYLAVDLLETSVATTTVATLTCSDADVGSSLSYTIASGDPTSTFSVSSSGVVTVAAGKSVDYDSATQDYSLGITVSDGTFSKSVTVKVTLTPVDDATPVFASNPTVTVSELESAGYAVTTYTATDSDKAPHAITAYAIFAVTSSGSSKFAIDSASGAITLREALDYDAGVASYLLTVTATDGGGLTGTGTVTVSVAGANDNAPTCTRYSWSVTKSESVATGETIAALGCTDADAGTSLNYILSETPAGSLFVINSGDVKLQSALNYETAVSHTVTVTVDDAAHTVTVSINVIVQDANDGPPVFSGPFSVTVAETIAVGTSVADVTAVDPDGTTSSFGGPRYSIVDGDLSGQFAIDAVTGRVSTRAQLDADVTALYSLKIKALEIGGANSATATLTVSVTNVNDVTPSCSSNVYYVTVAENTAVSTSLVTLACTDDTGTPTASISSGDPGNRFAFSALQLQTGATALDYETATSHTLVILLTDSGSPAKTGTATVYVTVTGVNEATPTWATWSPSTVLASGLTVSENTAVGTSLFTISATDTDAGTQGTVTYSLDNVKDVSNTAVVGLFRVDSVSGQVSTLSILDRDVGASGSQYTLTLRAQDGGGLAVTADVVLTISDYNDNAPVFTSTPYSVTIAENAATAGASLIRLTATDADVTAATLTYSVDASITGNSAATFRFSATTSGLLELVSAVDLDVAGSAAYTVLRVTVTDSTAAPIHTATASVTVSITTVNEYAPVFGATDPLGTLSLPETTAVGSSVATVTATDQDVGNDGKVTYALASGNTNNAFVIGSSSGVIRTLTALDFESVPAYSLVVRASDGGNTVQTSTLSVSVDVVNSNDNAPSCSSYYVAVTLAENAAVNAAVTSLSCTDADSNALTYTFDSGNEDDKFNLGSATGAITLKNLVDYDSATQSYLLNIRVSDGTYSQTVKVKVTLTAVNEATPTFVTNPTVSVSEAEPAGYTVTTYTATDSDYSPHNVKTYAIASVTNSGSSKFTIDQSTGTLRLLSPLNFEVATLYLLTITATDGGSLVGTGTVTVSVTDVNDNMPTCTQSSWSVTVPENQATGYVVASLGCTDLDASTTLNYALTQSPGTLFSRTGNNIILSSSLNYESAASHSVTVVVDDGTYSATVLVNVIVQDVNEGGPAFSPPYAATVAETVAAGTSVATVSAVDPDGTTSSFGRPQHSLVGGDPSGQFFIDTDSGLVSTRSKLNADVVSQYLLVIKAVEKGGANSASTTLTVSVSDVNDEAPQCTVSSFALTVNEPGAAGDDVLTLTCTDADVTATTWTYTLTSGDATKFSMNGNVLELAAPLDFDSGTTQYPLTIRVSDGANPIYVVGTVAVGPVNESPPVFTQTTYSVSQSESLAVGSTVATVTATDVDSAATSHGVVAYSFVTSQTKFTLNSNTGVILLASSLDRETTATFTLLVTATDGATTVTATVSVTVTDDNDNSPVCADATYTASVSETATVGTTVVTVAATDRDDPATTSNGAVTFSSVIGGDPNGDFSISTASGVITTARLLSAATTGSYSLSVVARDRGGAAGSRSATCVVLVTVTGVNQHDPVFAQTTYTQNVDENSAVGYQVVQVSATDQDSGSGGTVTYSMTSHAKFQLASADGWISVKAALDHETLPTTFVLEVVATDGGTPARSATATVSISVGDVNDNTAICTPSNVLTVQKREDFTGTLSTLTCTDADSGTNRDLLYTIVSVNGVAGAGSFGVSALGAVSVTGLNYETATSHSLIIRVADQGTTPRSTSVYLTLLVSDLNEADPAFTGTPLAANVAESAQPGTTVLTVAATDADGSDVITYSLADTTHLQIGSSTGEIVILSPFDYETQAGHTYTVSVCASDSNTVTSVRTRCETLTLTITDANDNDPVFAPAVYAASVDENKSPGFTVTTVTATDSDNLAAGGTVRYSIQSGNTGSVFRVDATGGGIIVDDNTNLDYETHTTFTLTVRASDGGGRSADASVTITVNPLNEFTPTFTPTSSTLPLPENQALGAVHTITASDSDHGADGQLTYMISSGAAGKFSIHPTSGQVSLISTLDRETAQTHTLTILAIDGGSSNPSAKTGTYTLTVSVGDVNDNAPSCPASNYAASVAENAAVGASVKDLSGCLDADLDPSNLNNALTYAITAGDAGGIFAVGLSGSVTVATASLDRETASSYTLEISVADKATSGKLTSTVTLLVTVSDVNDNDPAFGSDPYSLTVSEDKSLGFTVGTVHASDADIGLNGAVTYSLTSSSPVTGKLAVDPNTGDIIIVSPLDFETNPAQVLVVRATDKGVPTRSDTATVSVTVTDVDDMPPVCAASLYSATLAEDRTPGAIGVTVSCPDQDTASVTYSLTDPLFSVHSSTGVVSLTGVLNYETAQSHTLTVTASDGTRTDTTTVQVTVTDVNEFNPTFDPTTPYSVSVAEDAAIGFTVKDVGATDGDLSDTALTYSITAGNSAGKFNIDSVSGVIVVQGALDRETTPSYTLTLQVADGSDATARTSTTSIVITITDVNDNDPVCNPASYVASVAEGATAVATLTCSDLDSSTPILRYTLLAAGNTGTAFVINAGSGVITVVGTVDYETLTSYSLLVEVDDKATPTARTTTVPVAVTVLPVNEHAPVFPSAAYANTDVIESQAVGSEVITVAATDLDRGLLQGTVRYSIVAGDLQGHFSIDSSSGKIVLARALDRESLASYTLTVRASDDVAGSASVRSSDVSVPITVTDYNDNYPIFTPAAYTATVQETASVGGTVISVTVIDDDTGSNAAYTVSILSGNTGTAFRMVGSDLVINAALDYETTVFYDLVIQAVDHGTPALTSQARVSVTVQAVNEDAPILSDSTFSTTIPEDTPLGRLVYTASATDHDQGGSNDGSITYAISSGDTTPNSFIIDPSTGQVRVFSRLDFDTHPQAYTLTVTATDGGGLQDSVTLTIALTDVNDHTPQFPASSFSATLDENVSVGHSVTTIAATDNDSGVNSQITYSVTGGNGQSYLSIHATTGVVSTTAAINYEATPILYLVVRAADGGSPSLSATVLLRVTVLDLNDNAPVIVPDDYTVTISESASVGTSVAAVGATDADSAANNNNVVVYSLTSAYFQVDSSSGVVTTKAALDRETQASHVLLIVATDQGTNPQQNTVTATCTVTLTDVNDNSPVIAGSYDYTKPEDTAVGSVIFQVTATDADYGDNSRLTYSITNGNTGSDLSIVAANGMVKVANALDRERTPSYVITVLVADNGTPTGRSASTTATLTVSDVNDNDPVFTGTPYAFSVAENSASGLSVGRLAATDADIGLNANLVFTIQLFFAGTSSHFSLGAATGQLSTATAALDRESRDTYTIWCRVSDQGSPQRYADINVTVTVTDINDNPPVFNPTSYAGSVAENSNIGSSILTVTATDRDIGANHAITYIIDTSTAAGVKAATYLQVDGTTGVISVKANIDYEADTTFTFQVKATDGGSPALSASASVTVTVTDVNDNRPVFASTFLNAEVAYGGQCSNLVAKPVCSDADSGLNGQASCYLVASAYDYLFVVDGSTCQLSTQTIAAANHKYTVDVQCRDAGSPVLLAATPATVRVDTFIADNVVVIFQLGISRASFVAQQTTFLSNVQALVRADYPSAIVRLWCVQEREGTATAPSGTTGRRRLLADQPVDVKVYALQDSSTQLASNVGDSKKFLTADQLMAYVAADATGTPSSSVTGSSWNNLGIEKIRTYTEPNQPWLDSAEAIAIVTVAAVLGAVALGLLIYLCFRCYRRNRRPVTPEVRTVLVERAPKEQDYPSSGKVKPTRLKNDTDGVPDLDKTGYKKTSVSGLTPTAIAITAFNQYQSRKKSQEAKQRETDYARAAAVLTPGTVDLSTADDETYPIENREFDGRALDPVTGKVYEYSTKTLQRRWLESPPGYNV